MKKLIKTVAGVNLISWKKSKKMINEDIGWIVDVDQRTVSAWGVGRSTPRKETRVKIETLTDGLIKISDWDIPFVEEEDKKPVILSKDIKFHDIELVEGECNDCLFDDICSEGYDSTNDLFKSIIMNFEIGGYLDCNVGETCFKRKQYWEQATAENVSIGSIVKRHENKRNYVVVDKFEDSKSFNDKIIVRFEEFPDEKEHICSCIFFNVLVK